MPEPRDLPDDFVRFVTSMEGGGLGTLTHHYRASWHTVRRWVEETRLTWRVDNPPLPKSWGDVAPTKYKIELVEHYSVTKPTINRWIRESGINPKLRPARLSRPEMRARAQAKYGGDSKTLDAAAHFLRKFFNSVHRADIYLTTTCTWGESRGLPNKGKGFYYVDSVGVLTNEDMLTLARKHGYST